MRTWRRYLILRLIITTVLAAVLASALLIAVNTFGTSGTTTYRDAAENSATFVRIDGVDVHVVEKAYAGPPVEGDVPVFVLMHGFGASTFSWRDVVTPLSQLGDVIAYDRPGFGFSERPTAWTETNPYSTDGQMEMLTGIVAKFAKDRPVVLVGHSAGGQLAAEFALRHPESVNALVLVDPAILTTGGAPDWALPALSFPPVDRLAPLLVPAIAAAGDALLRQSFVDQSLITPEVYAGYHAPQTVIGWERGFWEFTKAPHGASEPAMLGQLTMPVLLITGAEDTVVPTSDTVLLHDMIPGSILVIIDDAGHLPQEERPRQFVEAITDNMDALHRGF
jgi:pimeloyl-ACP methyl ester carboxylesterase